MGLACTPAQAQSFNNNIKFQNGSAPASIGNRIEISAASGQRAGGNLFHSFSDFSLASGSSAVFKTPGDVSNILARVTGGNASSIDGTLRTELENSSGLSSASLYLINPSGIVFGPNAKLEVGGSFTATTADYVKFQDGGRFDARTPASDVLTTAPVSAFGFLGTPSPAGVTFSGSKLTGAAGRGLHAIAGSVRLEGAELLTNSGPLTLHAQAAAGEVPAIRGIGKRPRPGTLGAVQLREGSIVKVEGSSLGLLSIAARRLSLDGASSIVSQNTGTAGGAKIDIWTGTTTLLGASRIATLNESSGTGGKLALTASKSLTLGGKSTLSTETRGAGDGGAIRVQTTAPGGSVALREKSNFTSTTFAAGDSGEISVTTSQLALNRSKMVSTTGPILSGASTFGSSGRVILQAGLMVLDHGSEIMTFQTSQFEISIGLQVGDIVLRGSHFIAQNGSSIYTTLPLFGTARPSRVSLDFESVALLNGGTIYLTSGGFEAGRLLIRAETLLIEGLGEQFSGISSAAGFGADAGDITLQVERTYMRGRVLVSAFSGDVGGPGTLRIAGRLLDMTGLGAADPGREEIGSLGISINSGVGVGSIQIKLDELRMRDGTAISSSSSEGGIVGGSSATDIYIQAGRLLLDAGTGQRLTGIEAATATGGGGFIRIVAGDLQVLNGAGIVATSSGLFRAGDVYVQADSMLFDGTAETISRFGGRRLSGGIEAAALIDLENPERSRGRGGNITLLGGSVTLRRGAFLTASSATRGRAGSVKVVASEISLAEGSSIASTSTRRGVGGSLSLEAAGSLSLTQGSTLSVSAPLSDGGNLSLAAADFLVDGTSSVTATAGRNGGGVLVETGRLLAEPGSIFSASAGSLVAPGETGAAIAGNGGNLTFKTGLPVLDHALLNANAALGAGGNISLAADLFFDSNSTITATGTTAGMINILAPDLGLSRSLVGFAIPLVDASSQLRDHCALKLQRDFSSYLLLGRGGQAGQPEEFAPGF